MTRTLVASVASLSLLVASALAFAQSPPVAPSAATDEKFTPGPGGGEPDPDEGRPLPASTGLEDGGFCSCRNAGAPASGASGLLAASLLIAATLRRRAGNRA